MKLNIDAISQKIQQFFTSEEIESTARETGFVKRNPKLTGLLFMQAIVFATLEKGKITLSSLAQNCLDVGVSITEQGVDERINKNSVEFLRNMSNEALEILRNESPLAIKLLKQFSNVFLIDSSQISLPECMQKQFSGSGGNASKASMKVQLIFDYLKGHITHVDLGHGRSSDQGYRGHWPFIKSGALYIMDLGYFVLDTFKAISDANGYFLSRLSTKTGITLRNGEKIELAKWLKQQSDSVIEEEIFLGTQRKHRIPCRLVAYRLSKECADRRRHKAKKKARRDGRTASREHLELLSWSIYVTNVPSNMLQADDVMTLYRIRWQIELVFKMCKSFFGLDHIPSLRPERLLTEFYARLIGIVLTYFIIAPMRLPFGAEHNREISPIKMRQTFQRFARPILRSLRNTEVLTSEITTFFQHVVQFGFKQKRRKSPNSIQTISLVSACYEWDIDSSSDDLLLT